MKIQSQKPIYNGKSIREILRNLPPSFSKNERNFYVKNCIEVYKNQFNNINTGLNELIRNTNFMLIQNHIEN